MIIIFHNDDVPCTISALNMAADEENRIGREDERDTREEIIRSIHTCVIAKLLDLSF